MSLAAEAREAVRERPFLLSALRAGVVNHRAAAEFLNLDGDPDAVATALRRFAETLPEYATEARDARVTMHSGVGLVDPAAVDAAEPTLLAGDAAVAPDAGNLTAVVATGEVDALALRGALGRLAAGEVEVVAAGVTGSTLVVVVGRRAGARALRLVESALAAVGTPPSTD
jgi:hypothetical protein